MNRDSSSNEKNITKIEKIPKQNRKAKTEWQKEKKKTSSETDGSKGSWPKERYLPPGRVQSAGRSSLSQSNCTSAPTGTASGKAMRPDEDDDDEDDDEDDDCDIDGAEGGHESSDSVADREILSLDVQVFTII